MTDGAEVAGFPNMRNPDTEQAEYFLRLLDGRKFELSQVLEAELDELTACQRAGSLTGVRRHKRVVKALQAELRTVDRLMVALRLRLGLPTLRRTF